MAGTDKYNKELKQFLEPACNILLICHVNPDGDSIGSMIALSDYLQGRGKNVCMISPNYLQDFIKWMDGVGEICIYTQQRKKCNELINKADLVIMLDFNHPNRMGEAEKQVMKSKAPKVLIDHHLNAADFADLIISDPLKCSTAEIVYDLVTSMNGGEYNSGRFTEAIYVGIITDTGNFDHGHYTGETFRIIAKLIDRGIDKEKIFKNVFSSFEESRLRLLGYVLYKKMKILPEYSTAYMTLSKDELESFGYNKGDTEGFVNMPLTLKGIVFSALLIEKEDYIKLSFRSKGEFAVNSFACRFFGGGGHFNAAGGDYYDSLENTERYFLDSLGKFRNCET